MPVLRFSFQTRQYEDTQKTAYPVTRHHIPDWWHPNDTQLQTNTSKLVINILTIMTTVVVVVMMMMMMTIINNRSCESHHWCELHRGVYCTLLPCLADCETKRASTTVMGRHDYGVVTSHPGWHIWRFAITTNTFHIINVSATDLNLLHP
jgi:hypothetical protein